MSAISDTTVETRVTDGLAAPEQSSARADLKRQQQQQQQQHPPTPLPPPPQQQQPRHSPLPGGDGSAFLSDTASNSSDTAVGGDELMLKMSEDGDLEGLRRLLKDGGAKVNYRGDGNRTALMLAAASDQFDVVRYLIEVAKANLNAQDDRKNSALTLAMHESNMDVVRYLLDEAKADANLKYEHGLDLEQLARAHELHASTAYFLDRQAQAETMILVKRMMEPLLRRVAAAERQAAEAQKRAAKANWRCQQLASAMHQLLERLREQEVVSESSGGGVTADEGLEDDENKHATTRKKEKAGDGPRHQEPKDESKRVGDVAAAEGTASLLDATRVQV